MMRGLIYTIIITLIFSFMIGCKAKTVYVPVESVKTEYRDKLIKDSIHILDSVFLYSKNDTVFFNKYQYVYRDKLIRDTICKTDSIAVPYPVIETKEVNRLYSWQIILMVLGGVLIGYLGFRLVRLVK